MINAKGGKCELCGYNGSFSALQFHHMKPEEKEGKWIKESDLDNMILVCANCHRIIHCQKTEEYYENWRKDNHLALKHKRETQLRLAA